MVHMISGSIEEFNDKRFYFYYMIKHGIGVTHMISGSGIQNPSIFVRKKQDYGLELLEGSGMCVCSW